MTKCRKHKIEKILDDFDGEFWCQLCENERKQLSKSILMQVYRDMANFKELA